MDYSVLQIFRCLYTSDWFWSRSAVPGIAAYFRNVNFNNGNRNINTSSNSNRVRCVRTKNGSAAVLFYSFLFFRLMDDFSLLDLVKAYKDCRRHKRNTNCAVEFEFELEKNLLSLYDDLKSGRYEIGGSTCFIVLKPKPREVWAASFRDRIVHHLVYNAVCDRFYRRFISDTYSCIPDKGSLKGARKLSRYIQAVTDNYKSEAYFLKADIKNFFVSIDKNVLFSLLSKLINEQWILNLLRLIVFDNPKNHVIIKSPKKKFLKLPPHKSLWNTPADKGLPIGNLTSQFFSNVYLNVLDQFIKHSLKCRYYCRYVDDFVILDKSASNLNYYHKAVTDFIKNNLKLDLHQNKKTINKTFTGVDFVGFTVKHNRIFLRQNTIRRMFRLFYNLPGSFLKKNFSRTFHAVNSYMGFLRSTNGFRLRKKLSDCAVHSFFETDSCFSKLCLPAGFFFY